jgi:hypothetical protein
MWHAAKTEKTLFTPVPNHLFYKLQLCSSLPMPLILEMVTTLRSLSPPGKLWASIFCFTATILLGWPFHLANLIISVTLVIIKWSHAIYKYNEATPGGSFFPEITNANHSLPCLWKLPHWHIPFWSTESAMCSLAVHQPWTNKTQCLDILPQLWVHAAVCFMLLIAFWRWLLTNRNM